jgi:prefoldin subunit 5
MYPFILRNYEKIGYDYISYCESSDIVKILENNIDKINWSKLSKNCNNNAIKILYNNIDKIDWYMLSRNACDEAIKILKKYPDKINYDRLSLNKNLKAIKIYYNYYKNNKLLIDYISFNNWVSIIVSSNKNIFIKNYNGTNKRIDRFIRKLIL